MKRSGDRIFSHSSSPNVSSHAFMLQWRERNDIVNYSLIKIERGPITQFHGEGELTASDWCPTSSSTFRSPFKVHAVKRSSITSPTAFYTL